MWPWGCLALRGGSTACWQGLGMVPSVTPRGGVSWGRAKVPAFISLLSAQDGADIQPFAKTTCLLLRVLDTGGVLLPRVLVVLFPVIPSVTVSPRKILFNSDVLPMQYHPGKITFCITEKASLLLDYPQHPERSATTERYDNLEEEGEDLLMGLQLLSRGPPQLCHPKGEGNALRAREGGKGAAFKERPGHTRYRWFPIGITTSGPWGGLAGSVVLIPILQMSKPRPQGFNCHARGQEPASLLTSNSNDFLLTQASCFFEHDFGPLGGKSH